MRKNLTYLLLFLALSALAYWLFNRGNNLSESNPLSNFAIKDTSLVQKIFIADTQNNTITLERSEKGWTLNNKYLAKSHSVNLLLKTFATVEVQQPVSKSSLQTIIKIIERDHRKIEIYDNKNQLIKTWYLGSSTQNNQGTYALLETPNEGRSSEPFIVDLKGFRGYLTSRFHTRVNDWRASDVFFYPNLDMREISVELPKKPFESFKIQFDSETLAPKITDEPAKTSGPFDPVQLQQYVLNYRKVYLESFEHQLSQSNLDSLAIETPDYRISVTGKDGNTRGIDLFYLYFPGENDEQERLHPDRMLGIMGMDTVKVQRLSFDPLLRTRSSFLTGSL